MVEEVKGTITSRSRSADDVSLQIRGNLPTIDITGHSAVNLTAPFPVSGPYFKPPNTSILKPNVKQQSVADSPARAIEPVKNGGFMIPLVKLLDKVSKGQKLASIVDLYGEEVDAIYSPCDNGVVLSIGRNVVQPSGTPISVGHTIPKGDLD